MPLYEYQCDACGHRFEVIQKFSDAPIETCPVCKGSVHKLLSSPAIQFKGSGWYITDYARKGTSDSSASGEGKTGEGKAAKSETSADNKSSGGESKSEKSDASASSSSPSTPASTPTSSKP